MGINIGDKIKIINNNNDLDIVEGKIYEVIDVDSYKVYIENEEGYMQSCDKEFIERVV